VVRSTVLSEYTEARVFEKEQVLWSGSRLWLSVARWVRAVFIASAVILSTDEQETISVSSDSSPGLDGLGKATVQTIPTKTIPKQFPDELAEINPFVRNKVKRQFTSVPAVFP
jgi:hypothetical protein